MPVSVKSLELRNSVLRALVDAGGEMPIEELKKLYKNRSDGIRNSTTISHGYAEWVRGGRHRSMRAVAIRITDIDRKAFAEISSKPNPMLTIRDRGRLAWYGWKSPLPSYVTATESLWLLWREQFVAECSGRR